MKRGTLVAWWVRNAFQINLAHFGALIGEKKLSLLSNLEACSLFFFFFLFFVFSVVISIVTASGQAFLTILFAKKVHWGMGHKLPRTPIPTEMIYAVAFLTSRVWSYWSSS